MTRTREELAVERPDGIFRNWAARWAITERTLVSRLGRWCRASEDSIGGEGVMGLGSGAPRFEMSSNGEGNVFVTYSSF